MRLKDLGDIFDHGEMVGVVRVKDRFHRHLAGLFVQLLGSFAKGIRAGLVANLKELGAVHVFQGRLVVIGDGQWMS